MRKSIIAALLAGACVAFLPGVAAPADYSWTGPVSGDWSDPALWTPTGVPGTDPADTASITAATGVPYTVTGLRSLSAFTLDSLDATVLLATAMQQVSVNGPYVFQNGTVACARSMTWAGSGTLTNRAEMSILDNVWMHCPFVQNGILDIKSVVNSTYYSGARFTVDNGFTNIGNITLGSTDPLFGSRLTVLNGTLANKGWIMTFAGAGGAREIDATVVNDGDILVYADTAFIKSGGVHVNRNMVQVDPGKTLTITGRDNDIGLVGGQTFSQDAGTLQIDGTLAITNGATFNYNGGTILGTVLFTEDADSSYPKYINYLNIAAGATEPAAFLVRGMCVLGGDVHAGQTITVGSRDWIWSGTIAGRIGGTLGMQGSHTNHGTITIGEYGGALSGDTLVNAGLLNVNAASAPGNTSGIALSLTNNGEVNVVTPVMLAKNNGEYTNNGVFRLHNTAMTLKQCRQFTNGPDGTFSGAGTIDVREATYFPPANEGVFMNEGTLAPGLSIGTLAFNGFQSPKAFAQSDSGVLEIEIGEAGHDLLAITGTAALAGLLDVQLFDGFTPQWGDAFDVVTTTRGITDYGLALAPEDRGLWTVQYVDDGNTLRLVCVPEPATIAMLIAGGLGLLAVARRRPW
ncbi:MAG: PEP-CTERM sorting domain-containing protein [Pirellulales bacterium]|nr:PEP-CTERM sorting domain-containing protein [Pirellulales bacterium]